MRKLCKFNGLGIVLSLLFTVSANQAAAFNPDSEIDMIGGWRRDHIRSFITDNTDPATDLVKGSALNIWQIGVQGEFKPNLCEEGSWVNSFFIAGAAEWGWVNEGDYNHQVVQSNIGAESDSSENVFDNLSGNISRGHTWDYEIGLGYLFEPFGDCFLIGPTAGYAYNKLQFKAENVVGTETSANRPVMDNQSLITSIDPLTYFDEGVNFISKWTGPWAGVEARFDFCDIKIDTGYEYHFAHWAGRFTSPFPDVTDGYHFSDTRDGKDGHGQVFYLDACYNYCQCLDVGLGIKYQYYTASGPEHPQHGSFLDVGATDIEHAAFYKEKVKTSWHSFAITMDVGYLF